MSDISLKVGLKNPTIVITPVVDPKELTGYGEHYVVFVNPETDNMEIGVPGYEEYSYSVSNVANLKKATVKSDFKNIGSNYTSIETPVFFVEINDARQITGYECANQPELDLREYVQFGKLNEKPRSR